MADSAKVFEDFQKVQSTWVAFFEQSPEGLWHYKPDEKSWSLGQVARHLLDATLHYHFGQVSRCLANKENLDQELSESGQKAFAQNGFGDNRISLGDDYTYVPPQPENPEEVLPSMKVAELGMKKILVELQTKSSSGKSQHPFLGYLDAAQWFQLVEMHWRHHLKQAHRLQEAFNQQK